MANPFAMKITDFGGMIPRRAETLLPNSAAVTAKNCRMLSGAISGLNQLYPLEDLRESPLYTSQLPPKVAFPIGNKPDDFVWYPFENRDVMLVKGPLINDAYDRYYWTGEGEPKYNTEARIRAGDPPLLLGVPAPTTKPTVTPAGGTPQAARAYVYTFVSPYGEEGPPSPPEVATGGEGTWVISNLDATIPRLAERAPGQWLVRVYRTVAGQNSVLYYYVGEVSLGTTTFNDTVSSDAVVLNSILESEDWEPPPADLDYLVVHPNGFLVGFVGTDVYMSVPYRPHAWPSEHVLATEFPIVAIGVFGQSIAVATRSNPYILSGVEPLAMTFTKSNDSTPCLSRYGLVSFDTGVLYPSERGIMLVNGTDTVNMTEQLVTGTQWAREYFPSDILASVRYEDQYIAFFKQDAGFLFTPDEPQAAWSLLDQFSLVDSLLLNGLTGRPYVLRAGILYEWDSPITPPVLYTWRSKNYDLRKFYNLGAARINIDKSETVEGEPSEIEALREDFNTKRFAYPLAPIGNKMFGDVHRYPIDSLVAQNSDPAAGSALRPSGLRLGIDFTRFKVWADEVLVLETLVDGEELISLPSGFKAQRWQFEVQAYQRILSVTIGTSPIALATA